MNALYFGTAGAAVHMVDAKTGVYREAGHPLDGKCVKGRVLVFPRAKGSTVGSYILYALRKTGKEVKE